MTGQISKRCGCSAPDLDENGTPLRDAAGRLVRRQLGTSCPALIRPGGGWSPTHGTWWFTLEVPMTVGGKRPRLRQGGHESRAGAEKAMGAATELLGIAQKADDPDAATVLIAKMIRAAVKDRVPFPDPDEVRRKITLDQPLEVDTTVEQWLRGWLDGKKDIRPTTRLLYTQHIDNYLAPLLGKNRLDRLRVSHVVAQAVEVAEQYQRSPWGACAEPFGAASYLGWSGGRPIPRW